MPIYKSLQERFEEKFIPEPNSGCWLWTASYKITGYGQFHYKGKPRNAHRVSYEIYCEPVPDNLFVCHKCDNRLCVNPDHLFLGTNQDNVDDMVSKGRNLKGETQNNTKLTEAQVWEIVNDKRPQKNICEEYCITRQTVYNIKTGRKWNWMTDLKKEI